MEESESRTVYFLGSFGGRGAGHGLYEVKMEGGRVVGKSGELLDPVSMFFDGSNPEVPSMYLLEATRFGGRSKLYLLQHQGHRRIAACGSGRAARAVMTHIKDTFLTQ
jgi:hypothetical protein